VSRWRRVALWVRWPTDDQIGLAVAVPGHRRVPGGVDSVAVPGHRRVPGGVDRAYGGLRCLVRQVVAAAVN
jgi:hypothetical protein